SCHIGEEARGGEEEEEGGEEPSFEVRQNEMVWGVQGGLAPPERAVKPRTE
ncbi:uncharacterized, partial [Tachysurus ichikawai]